MKKRWTEDEDIKAKQLKKDGKTLREIALILGRSFETVKSKIYGNWNRYYSEKKETAQARALKWHFDNHDRSCANHKQWYKNNKEHHRELVYNSDFRTNKEEYNKYQQRWRILNPEKFKAMGDRWNQAHPELRYQINDRYRVRAESVIGSYTTREWKDRVKQFEGRCAYCRQEAKLTRDHIIALSDSPIGFIWNIVPVCLSCNSAKRVMNVVDFLEHKGYEIYPQLADVIDACFIEFEKMNPSS